LSDDTVVKQFPYDLKAEATTNGYRISGHVYGEDADQVVKDLTRIVSMGITEFESKRLPLAVNFIPKAEITKK